MNNAFLLMLKLVYPYPSKTFKVLSYCVIRRYGGNLVSNVTTMYITYYKAYLIVCERQETH